MSALDDLTSDKVGCDGPPPMQQGVGNSPFLAVGDEDHGLVVETHDLAATLALFMVEEAHGIADSHFLPAQPAGGIVADEHVSAIEIDGRKGMSQYSPISRWRTRTSFFRNSRICPAHCRLARASKYSICRPMRSWDWMPRFISDRPAHGRWRRAGDRARSRMPGSRLPALPRSPCLILCLGCPAAAVRRSDCKARPVVSPRYPAARLKIPGR